jgi:shikimate dehydrogenase
MKITSSTQLYGLFGYPAKHSLSPIIQNGWMRDHAIDAVYLAFEIIPDQFETALEGLKQAGLAGANVTLPFKTRAAVLAHETSPSVRAMGSANTLIFREHLIAHSTDGEGFLADLQVRAPKGWMLDGPIAILGAGGAASALAYALAQAGHKDIRLINRTRSRAVEIADLVQKSGYHDVVSAWDWAAAAEALEQAKLVINATSRGLKGVDPLMMDLGMLHPQAVVYDTVYSPRDTAFLQSASAQGLVTLDGLGMLVGQGARAFQHWFAILPDIEAGLERARVALERVRQDQ